MERRTGQRARMLDIRRHAVVSEGELLGAAITFADVTDAPAARRTSSTRSQRELETAYEELQSTIEELETTNEELQSTNEELETTNEELQSTNEELETMNEELQSDERGARDDQRRAARRGLELDRVNAFLESVLTSLRTGVIVLDSDQRVKVWNEQAEDMWGLRASEADGQHLMSLEIGLPVEKLKAPVRAALSGQTDGQHVVELEAVNRFGKKMTCRVTAMPLAVGGGNTGVVLLMENAD